MPETQKDIAQYQSDHDLLVTLNERVFQLTAAVTKKNDDHEERIRRNEADIGKLKTSAQTWKLAFSSALGLLGLVVAALALFSKI